MPRISIIVPVYNNEQYLDTCVQSILAQTFIDFELLLVDDGSEDKSGSICDSYARLDKRVRTIHRKNGGAALARMTAFAIATGEYISFIDADDWVETDMYEKMYASVEKYGAEVVICNRKLEWPSGNTEKVQLPFISGFYSGAEVMQKFRERFIYDTVAKKEGITGFLCDKFFKKKLLVDNKRYVNKNVHWGEDQLWSYPSVLDATSIYFCAECFYHYRQHNEHAYLNNISNSWTYYAQTIEQIAKDKQWIDCQLSVRALISAVMMVHEVVYHSNLVYKDKQASINKIISSEEFLKLIKKSYSKILPIKNRVIYNLMCHKLVMLIILLMCVNKSIMSKIVVLNGYEST
jgi:glycosyltransferase involved in cell wall biosynthesis